MQTDSRAALAAAKIRRAEATTALDALKIKADANAAELVACCDQVGMLEKRRAAAIASAKPAAVIAVDGELLRAKVGAQIAAARAAKGAEKLAAATAELGEAEKAVTAAAHAHIEAAMIELANTCNESYEAWLATCEQLAALADDDPLNRRIGTPERVLPPQVQTALERMPRPDPFHTPVPLLRGNGAHHNEFAQRLAELIR